MGRRIIFRKMKNTVTKEGINKNKLSSQVNRLFKSILEILLRNSICGSDDDLSMIVSNILNGTVQIEDLENFSVNSELHKQLLGLSNIISNSNNNQQEIEIEATTYLDELLMEQRNNQEKLRNYFRSEKNKLERERTQNIKSNLQAYSINNVKIEKENKILKVKILEFTEKIDQLENNIKSKTEDIEKLYEYQKYLILIIEEKDEKYQQLKSKYREYSDKMSFEIENIKKYEKKRLEEREKELKELSKRKLESIKFIYKLNLIILTKKQKFILRNHSEDLQNIIKEECEKKQELEKELSNKESEKSLLLKNLEEQKRYNSIRQTEFKKTVIDLEGKINDSQKKLNYYKKLVKETNEEIRKLKETNEEIRKLKECTENNLKNMQYEIEILK